MGNSGVGCCGARTVETSSHIRKHQKHDGTGRFLFVGRGGVSRLVAKNGAKGHTELEEFMKPGSAIERATLYSQDDDPPQNFDAIEAMDFWNINGAKIYSYTGIYNHSTPSDTVCAVLMLDRYAIQERPGDPANPYSFWPYRAFYSIPEGIDFAKCKQVGSAGANAGTNCAKDVNLIVNALAGIAEVALKSGTERVVVTGDCGYYALALGAYVAGLTEKDGWVRGEDVSFAVPTFRFQGKLEFILALGTTQLISSTDPAKTLVSRMDGAGIAYGTADLQGWYGETALDTVRAEYPDPKHLAHVVCANKGVPWGMMLADCNDEEETWLWSDVTAQLVEYMDTSMSFIMGMYIGYHVGKGESILRKETMDADEKKAHDKGLAGGQTIYEGWKNVPKAGKLLLDRLAVDPTPIFDFIKPALMGVEEFDLNRTQGATGDVRGEAADKDGDDTEICRALFVLFGPLTSADHEGAHPKIDDRAMTRIRENAQKILAFDEGKDQLPNRDQEVTIGTRYIRWFCTFQARLNMTVLKQLSEQKKTNHAIDGHRVFLFDCKYVPAFGKHVADGLTVWTHASHYFWMGSMCAEFAHLVQDQLHLPLAWSMECTELFSFTGFFQQNGMPTVDNLNLMHFASKAAGNPLAFRRFSGTAAPAAMLTDATRARWYRRKDIPLRTPDHDKMDYIDTREWIFPGELANERLKGRCPIKALIWDEIEKAELHFGDAAMTIGRNQDLYVQSVELVDKYLHHPYQQGEGKWRGKINFARAA